MISFITTSIIKIKSLVGYKAIISFLILVKTFKYVKPIGAIIITPIGLAVIGSSGVTLAAVVVGVKYVKFSTSQFSNQIGFLQYLMQPMYTYLGIATSLTLEATVRQQNLINNVAEKCIQEGYLNMQKIDSTLLRLRDMIDGVEEQVLACSNAIKSLQHDIKNVVKEHINVEQSIAVLNQKLENLTLSVENPITGDISGSDVFCSHRI